MTSTLPESGVFPVVPGKDVTIGEVSVWLGEPPNGNPYKFYDSVIGKHSLMGDERAAALYAWRDGAEWVKWGERNEVLLTEYTFWWVPYNGGAQRLVSSSQVKWH